MAKRHTMGDAAKRPASEDMEALMHQNIKGFLSKKDQGRVMGAFRGAIGEFDVKVKRKPTEEKDSYKEGYKVGYEDFGSMAASPISPYDAVTEPDEFTDWHLGFDHGWKTGSMHEDQMKGDPDTGAGTIFAVVVGILIVIAFAWHRGWL